MKIINREQFTNLCDCHYKGKIELTIDEFNFAVDNIMKNKKVNRFINGVGKYPYLSKNLLKEEIKKGKDGVYCLGVSFADYIQELFENKSKHNYKQQNYLIVVKNN